MSRLRPMLPYLAIPLVVYLLIALLNVRYGIFYALIPVAICAFIYGFRNRFHWSYLVYLGMTPVLVLPAIFIHFEASAFGYLWMPVIATLAGIVTGRLLAIPAP